MTPSLSSGLVKKGFFRRSRSRKFSPINLTFFCVQTRLLKTGGLNLHTYVPKENVVFEYAQKSSGRPLFFPLTTLNFPAGVK